MGEASLIAPDTAWEKKTEIDSRSGVSGSIKLAEVLGKSGGSWTKSEDSGTQNSKGHRI
jgi:hypothetical protein